MLRRTRTQRGDTLIEVLFAITVFSLVVVTALAVMNQGTASSQRSLEMTLVSQQVDNQAEALRFLHEAYVTNYQSGYATTPGLTLAPAGTFTATNEYYRIIQRLETRTPASSAAASTFNSPSLTTCPAAPAGSFIINPQTGRISFGSSVFTRAVTYSQLVTSPAVQSQGLWIEGVRSPVAPPATGFIDFHIRACWDAPGANRPMYLGTIVRLYEPRG